MSKFFVSRQSYWGVEPEDQYCVEIAEGGCDYANADMLCSKYSGEGEEYSDPREAVKVAIEIAEAWAKDCPEKVINIGEGFTMGCTMPFEGQPKEELIAWAEKRYEEMDKCPTCGEIMEGVKEWYQSVTYCGNEVWPHENEEKFCSEHCAEKASEWCCEECNDYFYYNKLSIEFWDGKCKDCWEKEE